MAKKISKTSSIILPYNAAVALATFIVAMLDGHQIYSLSSISPDLSFNGAVCQMHASALRSIESALDRVIGRDTWEPNHQKLSECVHRALIACEAESEKIWLENQAKQDRKNSLRDPIAEMGKE